MKKLSLYFFSIISIIFLYNCANVSYPSGGPKDVTPPLVLQQNPENGTTNFSDKKLRVWFDEYVSVSDLNNQFISSPPLKKPPKYIMKGKSVEFTIADTLKENTTYHLNFGNAIVDVNERNPYVNFDIAFSTGDKIDTMQVSGNIIDAFTLLPVKDVLLLLFDAETYTDSLPYKEIPNYIGRSDANGNFDISYIKNGKYKIFALEDANKNRIFDIPNERIAFLDSVLITTVEEEIITDTISKNAVLKDSVNNKEYKNTSNDSIVYRTIYHYKPENISLLLFEEENYQQYISGTKRNEPGIMYIFMNDTLTQRTELNGINFDINKCYTEFSTLRDSITIFIEDTNIAKLDTLFLSFKYQKPDSLFNIVDFTDTLKFIYKEKKKPKQQKKGELIQEGKNLIEVEFNVRDKGKKDLNSKLSFVLSYPVNSIDKNKFKLQYKPDETWKTLNFKLINDSINKRKYYIDFPIEENLEYSLTIDTNAFDNNFGLTNDTIIHSFTSQEMSYYGKIILNLTNVENQVIIQLFQGEEKIVREQITDKNGLVEFPYLKAGDYGIKLIFDENKNKKWDTGNYLEKIQPERIIYYDKKIQIKQNWDNEIDWGL